MWLDSMHTPRNSHLTTKTQRGRAATKSRNISRKGAKTQRGDCHFDRREKSFLDPRSLRGLRKFCTIVVRRTRRFRCRGGFETRPYNFVIFASFVVNRYFAPFAFFAAKIPNPNLLFSHPSVFFVAIYFPAFPRQPSWVKFVCSAKETRLEPAGFGPNPRCLQRCRLERQRTTT
jgi:hypothetical protein